MLKFSYFKFKCEVNIEQEVKAEVKFEVKLFEILKVNIKTVFQAKFQRPTSFKIECVISIVDII